MGCAERVRLFDELRAVNNRPTEIHELELAAVQDEDMPAFDALQPTLIQTREYRDVVVDSLRQPYPSAWVLRLCVVFGRRYPKIALRSAHRGSIPLILTCRLAARPVTFVGDFSIHREIAEYP